MSDETHDLFPHTPHHAQHAKAGAAEPVPALSSAQARDVFAALRDYLATKVVGHEQIRDRLALLGAAHVVGGAQTPRRATLIGPSGVGKTTLLRALAEGLTLPFAIVDCNELAETNWYGLQLAEVIADLERQAAGSSVRLRRSVIVLDELDKLTARGARGVTRAYQIGRQRSLQPLLGGARSRYGAGERDRSLTWDSSQALVVACGVFAGLPPHGDIGPDDLVRAGFQFELVERMGLLLRLAPLAPAQLARVMRAALAGIAADYERFGYTLVIADEACAAVARAVGDGRLAAGPRQAVTPLAAAAEDRLVALLNAGAPEGTRVVLTPDDVVAPLRDPPRRRR